MSTRRWSRIPFYAAVISAVVLALGVPRAAGQMSSGGIETIRFAPGRVPEAVTWSPELALAEAGLATPPPGRDVSGGVWVQSHPVSVGLAWRPPTSTDVRLSVEGPAINSSAVSAYARFSCDRVHWSTWQYLAPAQSQNDDVARFEGRLAVPLVSRNSYDALMRQWAQTGPAWAADEHEFCVWLARKEPAFFTREFPFIGYVQIRVEKLGVEPGVQVRALSVETHSVVTGSSAPPKRRGRTVTEKWFFDLNRLPPADD